MKSITYYTLLFLISISSYSQTILKNYKIGHSFDLNIPDYMSRTVGLNESAAVQYKNEVKDVYSFVIEDIKEELLLADLNFTSINEFYENFIKDFAKDEKSREVSKAIETKKNNINFIEADVTYLDSEANVQIYYLLGIVETKTSFYKIISWTAAESKDKFKEDFRKILYSLKD